MSRAKGFSSVEFIVALLISALLIAVIAQALPSQREKAEAQALESKSQAVLTAGRSYFAQRCHDDTAGGSVPNAVSYATLHSQRYIPDPIVFPFEVQSAVVYLERRGALSKARLQLVLDSVTVNEADRIRSYTLTAKGSGLTLIWEIPLYPKGRNDFINMYHDTRC
jgi:hypothetical protein